MPIVGVICGKTGEYEDFQTCIARHENPSHPGGSCHCPTASIKAMRDNHKTRKDAGVSASTILSCPREVALQEKYDYYEAVESGWHKFRGTLIHALMESDTDVPEGVIMEERVETFVDVDGKPFRLTGQMDYVDTKNKFLLDYKSKHLIPKKPDPRHEAQLNIYIYLLATGRFLKDKKPCNIEINKAGIHYLTFNTKKEMIWLKMAYPVWDLEYTREFIEKRAKPLSDWQKHGIFPDCDPFEKNRYWKCGCEKILTQLEERGVVVEELN